MTQTVSSGPLAREYVGISLPLEILRSAAGYYIGTSDAEGPVSRESLEYFEDAAAAQRALDTGCWTQRRYP
ncbi:MULTISPECIES: hypothetical protein [unclassified Serratia (in: enterobacteria)]|uniref:hypothetical protein n=1 Tax=unclassified Serratia (in: enterobacteria) TaxID=2647522 RepID=UPI0030766E53